MAASAPLEGKQQEPHIGFCLGGYLPELTEIKYK